MNWYEWIFDGIGTFLISIISSIISYKAAIKKVGKQFQTAKDNANQRQNITITNENGEKNVQSTIKQIQKAGNGAEQFQCGEQKNWN